MKPELTYELKQRFFAQYFGQNVSYFLDHLKEPIPGIIDGGLMKSGVDLDDYLLLRPVTSLTNGEAVEVAKIVKPHVEWIHDAKYGKSFVKDLDFTQCVFPIHSNAADYLRSIGVAIPFMGHSVDELLEAGWIKLTDHAQEK